jgi:hypothetical protein
MSRSVINQEFNTFVGGILTEANPINYPVGYTLDERNFILERNGTRRRRYGLEIEGSPAVTTLTTANGSIGELYTQWGDDRLVIGLKDSISYFEIDTEGNISSSETVIATGISLVTLSTYQDYLIVVRAANKTFTTWSGGTTSWPTMHIDVYDRNLTLLNTPFIRVRDYIGVDDSLEVDERPAVLSDAHHYNLLNQGWNDTNITAFNAAIGAYPSNSDNMNTGLDAATGVFDATWVDLANTGTTKTGSGGFKLDFFASALSRDEEMYNKVGALSGTLPYTILNSASGNTSNGICSIVEYAGRAFYLLRVYSELGKSVICYSKTNPTPETIADCFRENDPTSRDFNTSLETDGGYLDVSVIGDAIKMITVKDRLIVFGTKGVFEIFSSNNIFTPSAIGVRQITDLTTPPATLTAGGLGMSVTVANDDIFFFSNSGIIRLVYNPANSQYTAVNITQDTINSLYKKIPNLSKTKARGLYVPRDQTIRFLLNSATTTQVGSMNPRFRGTELVYDLVLKAWYKAVYNDSEDTTYINNDDYYIIKTFLATPEKYVTDTAPIDSDLRYIVVERNTPSAEPLLFAKFSTSSYYDFEGEVGQYDAPAFLQTGYINAGDSQRFKQTNYIIPSFVRTEDGFTDDGSGNLTPTNESSCIISAWWDYADDETHPKVNPSFEAYRYNRLYIPSGPADTFDYGQSVITTKNRLTGRGRALSLRFESSPGKDCQLLGWGMDLGVNKGV